MSILGAVVASVAGSLASSLLGKRKQKTSSKSTTKSSSTSKVNFAQFRRDAEAAGFNPLSVLAHASGFATQSGVSVTRGSSTVVDSGPSIGQALGAAALSGVAGGITHKLNADAAAASDAAAMARVKAAKTDPIQIFRRGGSVNLGGASSVSDVVRREVRPDGGISGSVQINTPLGDYKTRPDQMSDAQVVEDRYGDIVSAVVGVGTLAVDGWSVFSGALRRRNPIPKIAKLERKPDAKLPKVDFPAWIKEQVDGL